MRQDLEADAIAGCVRELAGKPAVCSLPNQNAVGKLKDVKIVGKPRRNMPAKGSLTIDADTASLVRRVCRHEGMDITTFVEAMLRAYIELHHRDWEIIEQPAPGFRPGFVSPTPPGKRPSTTLVGIGGEADSVFPEPAEPGPPGIGLARRITDEEAESYAGFVPNPPRKTPASRKKSRKKQRSAGSREDKRKTKSR